MAGKGESAVYNCLVAGNFIKGIAENPTDADRRMAGSRSELIIRGNPEDIGVLPYSGGVEEAKDVNDITECLKEGVVCTAIVHCFVVIPGAEFVSRGKLEGGGHGDFLTFKKKDKFFWIYAPSLYFFID